MSSKAKKTGVLVPRVAEAAWHTLDAEEALRRLDSRATQGISQQEAESRLEEFGRNQLAEAKRASPWALLLSQFKNILIVILLVAVALSGALGHGVEAGAIGAIVLFAVLLGFAQEYRAERAIEALRKLAAPTATVLRGGEEVEIPANAIVPGDIILLAAGDKVPADARVIESVNLHADEAPLTGESVPVQKQADALSGDRLTVGDRRNMVHAGTIITYGRGRAVVTATGMQTEFGKIAGLLQTVETGQTPLQHNLDRMGRILAVAALGVVVVISGVGIWRGQPVLDMIIFGIALAVAVVPEALPAVVTISLAIGVQRMVKRHALVRRLPAVETLGSTSVICSDKTGTLTKDEMTARKAYVARALVHIDGFGYEPHGEFNVEGRTIEPSSALMDLLIAGTLASDATLTKNDDGWDIKGDPTEGALVVAAAKAGLQKDILDQQFPRTAEIPFTSETKRMTTLHRVGTAHTAYAKGAPEVLVAACSLERGEAGTVPLTAERRAEILAVAQQMADDALRVLAVAMKEQTTIGEAESAMTFLGLVGMLDPPRPEAKEAVSTCKAAGIKTIMITGDHPATAQAVAKELGILTNGRAVTGSELDAMDEATFKRSVEQIEVYARVSPEHKLKVITALQNLGHTVAMTGDGVNDAPALKKADIGIAMGITGTDVTKEAAAMTLTDDNFASIVAAVEEGRGIFSNIKKYLMYLLSTNIGEILLMMGSSMFGLPLPLSAIQILFVNLATDGLPALALAVDPPEPDIMRQQPRDPRRGIFTRPVVLLMLAGGVWSMIVNLGLFSWALGKGLPLDEAMTITFLTLVLIEFFKAYSFRSDQHSILARPFANTWLNLAVIVDFLLLLLIIYSPPLQRIFETQPLPLHDWMIIIPSAVTIIPVLEICKFFLRRPPSPHSA